jgi:hypothetical protein
LVDSQILLPKFGQIKFFWFYLVCCQNFPIPHIWLAKFVTNIFVQLLVVKSLTWKILKANQVGP